MKKYYIIDNRKIQGSSYWDQSIVKEVEADSAYDAILMDYPRALGSRHGIEWYIRDAGLDVEPTRYVEAVPVENWKGKGSNIRKDDHEVKRSFQEGSKVRA